MELTVLVDNNTYIDKYFFGEPALSFYIKDSGANILFDLGYSDIFIKNAEKMGIDLKETNTIVVSHGHNDHTGGLKYLKDYMSLADIEIVAHPLCFNAKVDGNESIGSPLHTDEVKEICRLKLTSSPVQISDNLVFLGEIPPMNDFEARRKIGSYNHSGVWTDDIVKEDTALVYKGKEGLFIITGCSHSGICNILAYAQDVCNDTRITGIIGGFHLFKADEQLEKTIAFFEKNNIAHIYPCHCVSFKAKAKINEKIPVKEVGVGLTVEL